NASQAKRVEVRRIELRRRMAGQDEPSRTLKVVLDPGLVEPTAVGGTRVEELHADPADSKRRNRTGEVGDVPPLSLQREVERRLTARRGAHAREDGVLVFVEEGESHHWLFRVAIAA